MPPLKFPKKSPANAFTLIEALLSLLVISIAFLIVLNLLTVSSSLLRHHTNGQEQFFILQLRSFLALSSSQIVEEDRLHVIVDHEEYTIVQDKNRIVKKGGYEILLEGVGELGFYQEEKKIYIQIDGEEYQIY